MTIKSKPYQDTDPEGPDPRISGVSVVGFPGEGRKTDWLAREEPLEIRLGYGPLENRQTRAVAITMRTPGDDEELALGFLLTEGIVVDEGSIQSVGPCGDAGMVDNVIRVELSPLVNVDLDRIERHFFTTSSCGVCGKQSLEALRVQSRFSTADSTFSVSAAALADLPEGLRAQQAAFSKTGGLHAAATFNRLGQIDQVREDVGRHNAVDKLVGFGLKSATIPFAQYGILLSGRASFELVQKAVTAGCPFLAAVSAPSSLAVEAATEFGVTLVGFLRNGRFNIYSGEHRIC